jgi:hypothetical protein
MVGRQLVVTLVLLALVGPSTPALAQQAAPGKGALGKAAPGKGDKEQVSSSRKVWELYKQLYYVKAMAACKEALERGGNGRRELVYLLGFKGLIAGAQGRRGEALEAFKRMLAVDPRAKLGAGQSPRIQRAFKKAQEWVAKHGAISLASSAPASAPRGATIKLGVTLAADPFSMCKKATLLVRPAGAPRYTALEARPISETTGAVWDVSLASVAGEAGAVEYHVTVVDGSNNEVGLVGRHDRPERIALAGPILRPEGGGGGQQQPARPPVRAARPWYKHWAFWSIVGAAVVGISVGVGVSAASSSGGEMDVPISIGVR